MKKFLLLLVAFLGIGFAANAQSCKVADDGTYVAVNVKIHSNDNRHNYCECEAYCYGNSKPSSGTVYVTVYFINMEGKEDSELITISWSNIGDGGKLLYGPWYGKEKVKRIIRWEVSAGACQFR